METISLASKRQALLKHINVWYRTGGNLFLDLDLHRMGESSSGILDPCVCEDSVTCYCPHRGRDGASAVQYLPADSMALPLPSSVCVCPDIWGVLIQREEKLRVAQANEALQDLCAEIAKKSAIYQSNDDLALGKRDRLHNYDFINNVEKVMRSLVKRYEDATWALERLGVKHKYPQFQVICRADLKAVTAVYKPNAPGQRNAGLSWIWTIVTGADPSNTDYLSECTLSLPLRGVPDSRTHLIMHQYIA
jgi:hypothetical protein